MKNFGLFCGALVVSVFLFAVGILYNLGKSLWKFLRYWYYIFYQLCIVFKYLFTKTNQNGWFKLAYAQDLMWNVVAGEFLEDVVTNREKTMFGRGDISVSASTGKEVADNEIAKRGEWFVKWLDRLFKEPGHCINAWNKWLDKYE